MAAFKVEKYPLHLIASMTVCFAMVSETAKHSSIAARATHFVSNDILSLAEEAKNIFSNFQLCVGTYSWCEKK